MIEVPVYNLEGQKVEALSIDPAKLGGDESGNVRASLLKQALVYYHANQRQGTVRTQARGEVAGSTRKLFKQKGTGNARTGGIRNPIKVGGGHAKQKRPKDWRQGMNAKMRRLARDNAVLSKVVSGEIKVLSDISLSAPKTKVVAAAFKALGIDRSCLLALAESNDSVYRAARNIDRTTVTTVSQLNAWDILRTRTLLITK
ncbi:MAG: 50S ribosomal protein L4, partial [Proteobacteria bacterium]